MKQSQWLIALLFIFTLSACEFYNEHQDVTGTVTWKKGEKHTFKVNIEDNSKAYNVLVNLRHTPGLQMKDFDLVLTMSDADGKGEAKDYALPIRGANKEMLGSCAGDLCDTETMILSNYKFPANGIYSFEMVAKTEEDIPNMLEIGLILRVVE